MNSRMAVVFIILLLVCGCHGKKKVVVQESQPQFPLNVTGVITGNHDSTVWVETVTHQVYEYILCSGPNLLSTNEGGSLTFTWNSKDECYVEESATHMPGLDVKE